MATAIVRSKGFVKYCDFCAKTEDEATILIVSPNGSHICDECVGVCVEVILERSKALQPDDPDKDATP